MFHEGNIAFTWTIPDRNPRENIDARFRETASLIASALSRLGVDARVGEVPGEYCPGAYSVNARGRTKLMGVGQRIVSGAAHVGGVVVVGDSGRVRDVLTPVYDALAHDWSPGTVGSVEDELGASRFEDVRQPSRTSSRRATSCTTARCPPTSRSARWPWRPTTPWRRDPRPAYATAPLSLSAAMSSAA